MPPSPFIADAFLFQRLSSSALVAAWCAGRIAPARDGFEPRDFLPSAQIAAGADESSCWPFILFGGPGEFDFYAGQWVLQTDEILVRACVREDLAPSNLDFETYAGQGYTAILAALCPPVEANGIATTVALGGNESGTVHGLQLLPSKYKQISGTRGRRVCEMGATFRVTSN